MAGQVQARDLFFHFQQLAGIILTQVGHLIIIVLGGFLGTGHGAEQIQLAIQILAGIVFNNAQYRFHAFHHAVAAGFQGIKGTGFDQAFH